MEPKSEVMLALETSGDVCGVALLRDGKLVTEYTFRHSMHLSERLMEIVDRVLHDADAELKEVTAFAVGIGPGSFTGTRIGVMTAKTWASVLQQPIIGVSSLEAIAAEYSGLTDTMVIPLLPCRTGVVYACPFDVSSGMLRALGESVAVSIAELAELAEGLPGSAVLFCGSAAIRYRAELVEAFAGISKTIAFGTAEFPRAGQIARLARIGFASEEFCGDALTLVPLYISPPPISLPKHAFATATVRQGE